ncbi:MAG: hypothetical protein AVDCRST_MAG85-1007, partial [uncultured Solirubrobacteraceae bacterium]
MPRSPRSPRCALVLALLVLAATLGLSPSALASPLPGSSFDSGDGNQEDTVGLDWQGANSAGRVVASPDANDDCFVGGVKELTPNAWAFNRSAGGCTPGKSNLRVAFANPESAATTTFGHFGFFRNDTTGNSFLTFELNQQAASWTNATGTTIPCRSNGDVLISFEVGGSSLTTSVYQWTGDGSGPPSCPNGAAGTFAGSGTVPATRFQGQMNASALIQNFIDAGIYGATFPANSFGEAAIDLPAVMQSMGQSRCFGFLQMQVHSRSSSSISSAMIDYTTPVPVYVQSCAVIGTQYQDTNGNGTRDGGEPPLAGFRMYADLDDDGVRDPGEPTGVSDAKGFYRLLGVPAGTVRVRQEPKAGWRCSQPSPCSYSRSIVSGGNSTGNDFGNLGPSTATGTTYDDLDGDGTRDADEPGLGTVRVYADLDDDGTFDDGEPFTSSAPDGTWSLNDVPAGTYRIRQVTPASWTCSAPAPCSSQHAFSSGSVVEGIVFGSYGPATLSGRVFEDLYGDGGAFGAGDTAVAGRQVFLDANGNDAFDVGERQTTTDASGLYSIGGLAPGAYTVRVTGATGWYCTRPAATDAACELTHTVTSAQPAGGRDFGLGRFATVSGSSFDDTNGNGVRDETGTLAGFTHYVDLDGDDAHDAGEPSAVSATGGGYTITGVRAGSWTLRQLPNGAYACTSPSPCTHALTVTSNGTVTARNFLDYVSRSVSGTVFNDTGTIGTVGEAGETGVHGFTVFFDDNGDGLVTTGETSTTTNSLGRYTLTRSANGSYEVKILVQSGWACSAPVPCRRTGSIGSGQSDADQHFGVRGPAVVTGTLFEDSDGDGAARETGEPGLSGRTVYVDLDGDAVKDAGEPEATTTATGAYSVSVGTSVAAGTYPVRQVLPTGWTCSRPVPCTHPVTTTSGSVSGRDFGSYTTGSISGTVSEDADADGDADGPLAGRSVSLDTDGDGTGDATATTDSAGFYAFPGLAPGSYAVRQVLPTGWTQSSPAAGHAVTIASGTARTGRDFASWTTASITGIAFDDENFDESARVGTDDPLPGRTLYLDDDGDRTRDAGEPTATTDGSGAYAFSGLRPGAHTVRPVMPDGSACSFPDTCSATVTLVSGQIAANRDFGSYVGATVSGTVFEDLDADDAPREPGEPGLAGRRVFLDATDDGNETRDAHEPTMLTGADGSYAFSGVTAEDWQVRLELPAGFDCDSPSPCRRDLALTSGATETGQDFGVHTTATISGHLFTDRDADGAAQEFGENDQPERDVFLDADLDAVKDDGERTTTTDDRGDYAFAGVQPGTYRVRQVLPSGWTCSTPDPCLHDVTVVSGQAVTGRGFSSWTTASFTGTYFEDEDADGDYPEPADGGVAGRTVYLDLDEDAALDGGEPTTTTAANGDFGFANLPPDEYVVRAAAQPAAWTCSYPQPCFAAITLEANERAQDVNFGAWTTGIVAGALTRASDGAAIAGWPVYADLNGNAARDTGEPADTTDATGDYELTLDPKAYAILEVVPSGWTCTTPDPCRHDVTVTSQATISGRDFINVRAAALAGTVFDDADGDGSRDGGETGHGGVRVFLDEDGDDAFTTGEPSTTTAADGTWDLGVEAGTHDVRTELPADTRCDVPAGCERSATVASGETADGLDFALWQTASIGGTLTEDEDADGSGDAPLAGRTVYADLDSDGAKDDGEPGATTAGDGTYTISGLSPGTHAIRLVAATGSTCSVPDPCIRSVTVASAAAETGADFTVWRDATIDGVLVEDSDGDGTRDSGEIGIEGRTVFVDGNDNGTRDDGEPQATTGASGAYALTGLKPGTHRVRVVLSTGWRCAAVQSCAATVTTSSGDTTTHDVAAWRPATISGTVFEDRDADGGAREDGEGALAGRTVFADLNDDGDLDDGEPSATTDDDGAYAIGGLEPGSYAIRLVVPSGWECTRPATCTADVGTTSGSTPAGPDFGLVTVAADLAVAIERDAGDLVAGRPTGWTVTARNGGPYSAPNATLTITLPDGLSNVTLTPPDGVTCTRDGATITCDLGDLPVGASAAIAIAGDVGRGMGGRELPVSAAVGSDRSDPVATNDEAAQSPAVSAISDLRAAAALPPKANVGDVVDLVLEAANDGPSDATGVTLVATLPQGLEVESLPEGCTVAGRVVTCSSPGLAVGETLRRTLRVRVTDDGPLNVPVTATSDHPDPTPAEADADVEASPVADVQVLVVDPPTVGPDGTTYGLDVHNDGPSPATNVIVVDGPFPGAKIVSVRPTQGTCEVDANGAIRCKLGTIEPGADVRIVVVLVVDEDTDPTTVHPRPTASAEEADPTPANNVKALELAPRPAQPAPAATAAAPAAEPRLAVAAPSPV